MSAASDSGGTAFIVLVAPGPGLPKDTKGANGAAPRSRMPAPIPVTGPPVVR